MAEIFLLVVTFLGTGVTSGVFWHAAIGVPLVPDIWDRPPPPSFTGADAAPRREIRENGTADASSPGEVRLRTRPSHVFLDVPFTPQSPRGDWGQPYQDACEEASVAMAMAWVRGADLTPNEADDEILGQVAYERYYFGYHRDTALRETLKLFTRYYQYPTAAVLRDITTVDIQGALAAGNLVLLPVAGELIANPYYARPPVYHMVVVVGYDDEAEEFIVHDPGTKRGKNFRYNYDLLWNAVHDWTGDPETILGGAKAMIVVAAPRT